MENLKSRLRIYFILRAKEFIRGYRRGGSYDEQ